MQQTVFTKPDDISRAHAGLYRVTFDPAENAEGVTTAAFYTDAGGKTWVAPINWPKPVKLENISHQIEKLELIQVGGEVLPQPKEVADEFEELRKSNAMFHHLVDMMGEIPDVKLTVKQNFDPPEGNFVDLTFTKEDHSPGYTEGMYNVNSRSVTVSVYVGSKYSRANFVEISKPLIVRALQEIGVQSFRTIRQKYLSQFDQPIPGREPTKMERIGHALGIFSRTNCGENEMQAALSLEFPEVTAKLKQVTKGEKRTQVDVVVDGMHLTYYLE